MHAYKVSYPYMPKFATSSLCIVWFAFSKSEIVICDPLREKGDFRAKCIYKFRSKVVEYAPPRGLPV